MPYLTISTPSFTFELGRSHVFLKVGNWEKCWA